MFTLLQPALTSSVRTYLKSRRQSRLIFGALLMLIAAINVYYAFASKNSGIGMTGSFVTLLLDGLLSVALVVSELFFSYEKVVNNMTQELYLRDQNPVKTERYCKDVLQVPAGVLRRIVKIAAVATGALTTVGIVACASAFGAGAEKVYTVLLTVFSAAGVLSGAGLYLWYASVVKKFVREREGEVRVLRPDEPITTPVAAKVDMYLQFGDEGAKKQYKVCRILVRVLTVAALAEFIAPLPVFLSIDSAVGIVATAAVALFIGALAVAAHVFQIRALRRNIAAQPDDRTGGYRKMMSRVTIDLYSRWIWRFVIAMSLAVAVAVTLLILEKFEILTTPIDMPTYSVLLGIPLIAAVALWFGVDMASGRKAFLSDYTALSELLRPGLLVQDAFVPPKNADDQAADRVLQREQNDEKTDGKRD